jgi:hypothetical protein
VFPLGATQQVKSGEYVLRPKRRLPSASPYVKMRTVSLGVASGETVERRPFFVFEKFSWRLLLLA